MPLNQRSRLEAAKGHFAIPRVPLRGWHEVAAVLPLPAWPPESGVSAAGEVPACSCCHNHIEVVF